MRSRFVRCEHSKLTTDGRPYTHAALFAQNDAAAHRGFKSDSRRLRRSVKAGLPVGL